MQAHWLERFSPAELGRRLRSGLGSLLSQRSSRIADRAGLRVFLESRASFVAQTSLYGYLRTRAGMQYPILFEDDVFVRSVNIAKWHVWLACLSDLAVFAGGLIVRRGAANPDQAGALMLATLDAILEATGMPAGAGGEFTEHAQRVRSRLMLCQWASVADGAATFSESGPALVHWAPIVDELKRHDAHIVSNSIRFAWQEVRRALRRDLDAAALMACAT